MGAAAEELCDRTATALVRALDEREVSASEVMEAHLARIERVNPHVNAIVTYLPDAAMEAARAADRRRSRGEQAGRLDGLPVAVKDTVLTKGIRTTFGSPVMRDFVPDQDGLVAERHRRAGAIVVGKTNTPEFGAGSQTFNTVFGVTRNPWDLDKTCGGSSGGAAVAVACGMVPLADGSDMGGSLRNPAAFCNVVGLRPSPGRVPWWPSSAPWFTFVVEGPIARTAEDAALLLSVLAGPDDRSPIALDDDPARFAGPLDRDFGGVRVAFSPEFAGLPFDPRVSEVVATARGVLEGLGCVVRDGEPDFSGADEAFKAWRAWFFELAFGPVLDEHREQLKDTVVWEIERGRRLGAAQLGAAERARAELYHRVREYMRDVEFLALPVTQVPPFDVSIENPTEIAGEPMETYIDWMKSCYFVTATGLPAISVPCGFTSDGLPVGLQLVGRHRDDLGVLQLAHAFERATQVGERRPAILGEEPVGARVPGPAA